MSTGFSAQAMTRLVSFTGLIEIGVADVAVSGVAAVEPTAGHCKNNAKIRNEKTDSRALFRDFIYPPTRPISPQHSSDKVT
jgi:hypothetical protein